MRGFELFPEAASTQAYQTDRLFLLLFVVSAAIVLLVVTLVVVFSIRYRRDSTVSRPELAALTSREFEIAWTSGTFFLALFLFGWTGSTQLSTLAAPKNAIEVHVEAKQWMWKTQHSNGVREINALHVPVNEPVRLIMTSEDVIHSFFVPAFRIKKDVLPGRYTETWFKATQIGTQHLFCTQYCGTQHSHMIGEIVVMTHDDFARWLRAQPEAGDLAKQGEALFVSLGCSGCHATSTATQPIGLAVHAPGLAGVYGGPVHLSDGRTVIADDAYIRDSILQPAKDVVAGYEPLMPSFQGLVGDDEILRLTAYIRSLKDKGTPQ